MYIQLKVISKTNVTRWLKSNSKYIYIFYKPTHYFFNALIIMRCCVLFGRPGCNVCHALVTGSSTISALSGLQARFEAWITKTRGLDLPGLNFTLPNWALWSLFCISCLLLFCTEAASGKSVLQSKEEVGCSSVWIQITASHSAAFKTDRKG